MKQYYLGAIYKHNNRQNSLIPCKNGGYSDARLAPCTTRGGVSFARYEKIILLSGRHSRKQATEKRTVEQVSPGSYECAETFFIPLSEVHTDTEKFQQRESEFSSESVGKIINAVNKGVFNWQVFDPVLLWQNPQNNKLYVLSGHSRTEAFKQLAAAKATAQGRNFTRIPARIIKVSEPEAIKIALMSNTLSTPETPIERANYYRNLLHSGTPLKEVTALAEQYEGKNATSIMAFSHLNPTGALMQMLRSFKSAEATSRKQAENLAQYVGEARKRYPMLTNLHEREMWNFINSPEGAKAIKSKIDFLSAISRAVDNNTEFGVFDTEKPLNLLRTQYKSAPIQEFERQLQQLKVEIEKHIKDRDSEFRNYINKGYTAEQINPVLKKHDNTIMVLRKQYADLLSKRKQVETDAERQAALFGISQLPTKSYQKNKTLAILY